MYNKPNIETNELTYQKWKAGDTMPDGYFLIRLLNWLDILIFKML